MGINVYRWLVDSQYRAIKRWKRARGDTTLKVDFPLSRASIVFDVGAFEGSFAAEISRRYGSRVEAFEPVKGQAEATGRRLAEFPTVTVHSFGLLDRDHSAEMQSLGEGSSLLLDGGHRTQADFRDILAYLEESGIEQVDLLKLNIEGSEYALLEHVLRHGAARKFRRILVQFHLFTNGDRQRYEAISRALQATHRLSWRFPFVWELWSLVDERG